MGFTFATPTIVAGTVLVVEAVQSQNYAAGSAGWYLAANGDAEIGNLTARGSFVSGSGTGPHVEITSTLGNIISFYTGDPAQTFPGRIVGESVTPGTAAQLTFASPQLGATSAGIALRSSNVPGGSEASIQADRITLAGPVTADSLRLGLGATIGEGSTVNGVQFGSGSFTVDATSTGRINIPHTLGVVPTAAFVTFQNSQQVGTADLTLSTTTSIVVVVRNITAAGAVLANGTGVVCRYLLIT
jgi:hypothetical protein